MFASALIVFREVLEAALIVSIVMAASRGVAGRGLWVSGGIAAGIAGACVMALFADAIAMAAEGVGQEILNASILFLAVCMLGWHNIWMASHGRELAREMSAVGHAVAAGSRPLYALALVVGLAVLREGAEIVLFLYGIAASGGEGPKAMALGGGLGVLGGVAVGIAMYGGLLRLSQRYLFAVTSWLILLLAAGMAAHGAGYLAAAGLLPDLIPQVWDTSGILPETSVLGRVLQVLIGYIARPTGLQALFYVGAILVIGTGMRVFSPAAKIAKGKPAMAAGSGRA